MQQDTPETLFVMPAEAPEAVGKGPQVPPAPPRLRRADRAQVLLRPCALDETLDADHKARLVWAMVKGWDLSRFLEVIAARGETAGRAAIDPLIVLCLWLYAYSEGVSNGRELERLCQSHDAYRWICGGVSVNYHTLNDFRVRHEAALDDLLTQMVAALMSQELIQVDVISHDGTRQRASAGRNSFKTRPTLEKSLEEARAHVEAMKQQAADPNASLQRQKGQERAAREKVERLEKAMEEIAKVEAAKARQKEKPSKHNAAKASTTDPEARKMHVPNGGTDPAYNVQFAVAVEGRAIIGVDVTNAGSDVHESQPMREQVEARTGMKVLDHLVDGGYIGLDSVEQSAQAGTTIYAPLPKGKKEGVDPHAPKKGDGPGVIEWRKRMETTEAKELYKKRTSTVETANGECKAYRGLERFLVRGINKVRCVALWSALAYNFMHFGKHLVA